MSKSSLIIGTASLLAIAWTLVAQEPSDEEATIIPKAEPIDPAVLEDQDIPRALPVVPEAPRAKPVAAEELERLKKLRDERRLAEEADALRLKQERERKEHQEILEEAAQTAPGSAGGAGDEEPVIPRAIPVGKSPTLPDVAPEAPRLSPMDVASQRAPDSPDRGPEKAASKIKASWLTRTDARSFTMLIPAPRGQIVDRWGQPLVQNKVANILAIKLPQADGTSEAEVLRYARSRISRANRMLGEGWEVTDEAILKHFKNRRWLPLMFSSALTTLQEETITPMLDKGMIMFPTYVRHYPEKKLAAHIVGYAGKTRRLPTGPVVSGDPLFPQIEGRDGLEISFDADLQGTPGIVNYLFDSDGTELDREIARQAIPGATVVSTLDLEMQQLAENILETSVKRGAFVVMNVHTGEILTMASYPAFDPNDFSPSISQTRFDELNNDPDIPLFARAFRGSYPPASTFKVVTALAALESGTITEQTLYPCPTVMIIDKRPFRNWNKKGEGDMNVVTAIARSCNPFFYRAGLNMGGQSLSTMGYRLGFGQKTGIQLFGEEGGYMPSDASDRERFGHRFAGGHLANASIGQGNLSATPLQVCQMMAGIANGSFVPQARLVKQVQDYNNRVIKHFPPQEKTLLNLDPVSLDLVRRGMVNVVNASWGTGKAASNDYVTLAGKTGTGQWGQTSEKRYLAWFAGFVPAESPEYAFAVLYEGDKGQTIGGGRVAAPLAGRFFNAVYQKKKQGGELADYKRAVETGPPPKARTREVAEAPAPAARPPSEPERQKKRRGFFSRLGRGR